MASRIWIFLGGLLAAIGIGLSAFHAHGLEPMLSQRGLQPDEIQHLMADFETGVRYQLYHAVALVLVGLLTVHFSCVSFSIAGTILFVGTVLFSGSLYVLVLAGQRLPHVAPIGGTALIVGWVVLAVAAILSKTRDSSSLPKS